MNRFDSSQPNKVDHSFVCFVKGIAILLIFGHHWARSIVQASGTDRPTLMQWHFVESTGNYGAFLRAIENFDLLTIVEHGFGHWGYIGVNMFVVISGFGLSYQGVGTVNRWGPFIGRRLRKLLPAFYCVVLVFGVLQYSMGIHSTLSQTLEAIFIKASFLFLLDRSLFLNDNSPLWFFGLIIPLYFCFPLLYKGASSSKRWYLILVLLVFSSLVKFLLQQPVVMQWHPFLNHGFFLARLPEFSLGITLGYLCKKEQRFPFSLSQLGLCAVVAFALAVAGHSHLSVYILLDPSLAVLSICGVICLYTLLGRGNSALVGGICWIGAVSFSVYLIHRPIITFLYQERFFNATSGFMVVLEGTLLLGGIVLCAWCLEVVFRFLRVIPGSSNRNVYP